MDRGATRLGAAALALAGVWVVFFWWTPPAVQDTAPHITFGTSPHQQQEPLAEPRAGDSAPEHVGDVKEEPANSIPVVSKARDLLLPLRAAGPAVKIESVNRDVPDARANLDEVSTPLQPQPIESEPMLHYTVQSGDTLSEIAQEFYGRSVKWRLIRDANLELVGEEGRLLQPGQILVIPLDPSSAQ